MHTINCISTAQSALLYVLNTRDCGQLRSSKAFHLDGLWIVVIHLESISAREFTHNTKHCSIDHQTERGYKMQLWLVAADSWVIQRYSGGGREIFAYKFCTANISVGISVNPDIVNDLSLHSFDQPPGPDLFCESLNNPIHSGQRLLQVLGGQEEWMGNYKLCWEEIMLIWRHKLRSFQEMRSKLLLSYRSVVVFKCVFPWIYLIRHGLVQVVMITWGNPELGDIYFRHKQLYFKQWKRAI